jgi:predicted DNA-binding WGR domain protein
VKIKSQTYGTFAFPSSYDVIECVTLNKTDLTGGNNKYYHIEAHASKDGKKFRLYSRYGRVGNSGVEEERIPPQNEQSLKQAFQFLKKEKTGSRKGYVEVKLASAKMGSEVGRQKILSDDIKKEKVTISSSGTAKIKSLNLHTSIKKLVDRLYSEAGKAVRSALSGSLKTSAENPLGTLTLTQIESGRSILQEIQKLLTDKPNLKGSIDTKILDLSNQFYSVIPQTMENRPKSSEGKARMDTWLKKMALNNEVILDEKENLLELLSDVQGMVGGFAASDIDKKYLEIGCQYEYLDNSDPTYKRVEKYMMSTRSKHHDWKCEIRNIWKVSVSGQKDKHLPKMKEIGNIKPLFHGSGPQNILGICKHGLLMRPPGVYITGSMFGNGLYFADQSSKSEQYAFGRFGGGAGNADTFFMFVADVSLGKIKEYTRAQPSLNKPPNGYNSVQGKRGYSLMHNEFIVYDIKQHILQYLIEFKTNSSWW